MSRYPQCDGVRGDTKCGQNTTRQASSKASVTACPPSGVRHRTLSPSAEKNRNNRVTSTDGNAQKVSLCVATSVATCPSCYKHARLGLCERDTARLWRRCSTSCRSHSSQYITRGHLVSCRRVCSGNVGNEVTGKTVTDKSHR